MAAPRRHGARGWGLPILVVVMVSISIFEVWLVVKAGQTFGVLPTLLALVASAVLGAWLLKREGAKAWTALMGAITRGSMPTGELADAALVLSGGILLMLPGFVTDVVGLFCLLPLTRPLGRSLLAAFAARSAAKRGIDLSLLRPGGRPGAVIPGEVVPDETSPPPAPADPDVIRGEIEA